MCFTVYILYSKSLNQYYVGHTEDMTDRLFRHTNSGNKFTKKAKDWELVYKENFQSRPDAYKREVQIKNKKSRRYIEWLISSAG
jgi:putative endonuclease